MVKQKSLKLDKQWVELWRRVFKMKQKDSLRKRDLEAAVNSCEPLFGLNRAEKTVISKYEDPETHICKLYLNQEYRYGVFCKYVEMIGDTPYCMKEEAYKVKNSRWH